MLLLFCQRTSVNFPLPNSLSPSLGLPTPSGPEPESVCGVGDDSRRQLWGPYKCQQEWVPHLRVGEPKILKITKEPRSKMGLSGRGKKGQRVLHTRASTLV